MGGEGTGAWLPCGPCPPLCTAALVAFLVFHQAMCSLHPISQGLCKCGFLLHLQVSESGLSARKPSLSPGPGQSLVLCSHRLWVLSLTAFLSIYNCISPAWSSEPNCLPHWAVNSPRTETLTVTVHPFPSPIALASSTEVGALCLVAGFGLWALVYWPLTSCILHYGLQ